MIHIKLPATMRCDEQGCQAEQPVTLVLLGNGGYGFQVPNAEKKWQIILPRADLNAPFLTRCEEHPMQTQVIQPSGPIPGLRAH